MMTSRNRQKKTSGYRLTLAAVGSLFVALAACGNSETDDTTSDGGQSVLDGSPDAEEQTDARSENGSNNDAEEETCGASPFESSRRPVNILLVIDKSGSMDDKPTGFEMDKWSAMKNAFEAVLHAGCFGSSERCR